MYIGTGVAAGIVMIIVALVLAYFIMARKKRRRDELESMPKGVGNPVFDTDDGQKPLEDFFMSDVDTNMFATDDNFRIMTNKPGAISMDNPLYLSDPYQDEVEC
ncbi:unnamed protein product [Porites evermanni]|uniref:Uncharacterized protein n=1 Tax=Porites evermanni TaxID=104178 RepID=A0ABN8QIS1_9CNID|nr:unnamed protein product [Porites evermanni]